MNSRLVLKSLTASFLAVIVVTSSPHATAAPLCAEVFTSEIELAATDLVDLGPSSEQEVSAISGKSNSEQYRFISSVTAGWGFTGSVNSALRTMAKDNGVTIDIRNALDFYGRTAAFKVLGTKQNVQAFKAEFTAWYENGRAK